MAVIIKWQAATDSWQHHLAVSNVYLGVICGTFVAVSCTSPEAALDIHGNVNLQPQFFVQ